MATVRADYQVIIAGAGPTGLMLAGELALQGIDVAVLDRRADQTLAGMRAGGLHMRSLEILDQRGIVDRFVAAGVRHQVAHFHGPFLDVSDMPTRHNYFLELPQNQIERLLAGWVDGLDVPVHRGLDLAGFSQDQKGVDIQLMGGGSLRADWLIGCDGARSLVRKTAGIDFVGTDPSKSWLIAEAEWRVEPEWGFRHDAHGTYALGRMDDPGRVRLVLAEHSLKTGNQPAFDDVLAALEAVYGTDFGIHDPTWVSRFTDMCRQAVTYRAGRVLLAGDAAHIHPPHGGQGLNIGLQDAVNLGWKLALVARGMAPESLLDSYGAERHPVGARVLENTQAMVALQRQDAHSKALGQLLSELAVMDAPRRHILAERSGLGVHYDLGPGHPLLGRRMPDLDIETADGPVRLFSYLHTGQPVLVNLGAPGTVDPSAWADRVQLAEGTYDGLWDLPGLGPVAAPSAVLVRPDGYVAWVGTGTDEGLMDALAAWFGPSDTMARH